jgi:hypothetical protein
MGNITDLLMMSRANISYSTESFPGPAKPQSVQAALTSAATSARQKFECACSIVLATHGKKAALRDASLQRPTGHYGQTASSSTWSLTRHATVHDVRDFYTVTKKTGQALQSATYVKLTRRKAPASAPIRPVYDLPATDAIYQRFVGIDGSAYFVGGLGMTTLTFNNIVVVPICSGVGLRLGANVGYLKFTPTATWNPF